MPLCESFEVFLTKMRQAGFTVNDKRKHITLKAPGQRKPARLNTLKGDYTEQAIRDRIAGIRTVSSGNASGKYVTAGQEAGQRVNAEEKTTFNLLIDIQDMSIPPSLFLIIGHANLFSRLRSPQHISFPALYLK